MALVVNLPVVDTFYLRDDANVAIASLGNDDFDVVEAYQVDTPATTASVSINWITDAKYTFAFTPTTAKVWAVRIIYDSGGVFRELVSDPNYDVITAAQADPVSALSASEVTVVSPVAASGDVTLYQGDDYANTDSRALEWATTDSGTWPTLTSATISFVAKAKLKASETITAAGSVVTGTGVTKEVRVELTDTQTAALDQGDYSYQVIATLSSGNVVTLTAGDMTVTRRLP